MNALGHSWSPILRCGLLRGSSFGHCKVNMEPQPEGHSWCALEMEDGPGVKKRLSQAAQGWRSWAGRGHAEQRPLPWDLRGSPSAVLQKGSGRSTAAQLPEGTGFSTRPPGGLWGSWDCDGGPVRDCESLKTQVRPEGGNRGGQQEPRGGTCGAAGDCRALCGPRLAVGKAPEIGMGE